MRCCAWDVAGLAQHGVSEALKAEVSKAISGKLRGLQAADWPIVAAVAATFLVVATLPQNSTALADQVVAGHLRSLAMFASAWAHARAEVQRGVSKTVLLQFHRLLHAAS
jgi:hypothetical protein